MALINSHGVTVAITAVANSAGYTGPIPDFTNIYDMSPPSGGFSIVNITSHADDQPQYKPAKMSSEFPSMSVTTDYDGGAIDFSGTMCSVTITPEDDAGASAAVSFQCVITGCDSDGSFTAGDSEFRKTVVNFDILKQTIGVVGP